MRTALEYKVERMVDKQKEQDFLIECIHLYRDLPALWQIQSKEYHDRDKKNKAYKILLSKYRQMFPDATKDCLKKKFNSLRTNYRKELRRHQLSLKPGYSEGLYESTLWYYKPMDFLKDLGSASGAWATDVEREGSTTTETERSTIMDDNINTQDSQTTSKYLPISAIPKKNAPKPISTIDEERIIESACKRLKEEPNDYQNWGLACAADLQRMEPMQQIYAKKAIADIIMEGQLGLLRRNSVKINDPTFTTNYEDPLSMSSRYSSTPPPRHTSIEILDTESYVNDQHINIAVKREP